MPNMNRVAVALAVAACAVSAPVSAGGQTVTYELVEGGPSSPRGSTASG